MASSFDFVDAYQWEYRPRLPVRPAWFTAWPGGARLAVSLLVLCEWESIPRPAKPLPARAHHTFDYLALGTREYGLRSGVPRLLDLLAKHQVHATVVCSGLVAELFPETVQAIYQAGHDLATHQWDQAIHPPVFTSAEEERASLQRAVAALERVTGERVGGYMSQGPRPTPHTLDILAEMGFLWTADYSDADVPYTIDVRGQKLVSVGWVMPASTDNDMSHLGYAGVLQQLKDEFDAHYEESEQHPMKLRHALHVHVSGRPGMAHVWDAYLSYVQAHAGVWLCTARQMAEFWRAHDVPAG